ncbi:hypothetical protein Tco_0677728 [Tanacetum coccineum]|uniref:BLOC-1-related complex subunit 5 n=1 Tax=Tanacetum coccineum TaxID=301880 RepID=A0ABQ4XD55_9ASTR
MYTGVQLIVSRLLDTVMFLMDRSRVLLKILKLVNAQQSIYELLNHMDLQNASGQQGRVLCFGFMHFKFFQRTKKIIYAVKEQQKAVEERARVVEERLNKLQQPLREIAKIMKALQPPPLLPPS